MASHTPVLLLQSVAFSDSHTHLHLQALLLLCTKHCCCLSPQRIQTSFQGCCTYFQNFLPIAAYIGCSLLLDVALCPHHRHCILGRGQRQGLKDTRLQNPSFIFILSAPLGPHRQVYALYHTANCLYQPSAF